MAIGSAILPYSGGSRTDYVNKYNLGWMGNISGFKYRISYLPLLPYNCELKLETVC